STCTCVTPSGTTHVCCPGVRHSNGAGGAACAETGTAVIMPAAKPALPIIAKLRDHRDFLSARRALGVAFIAFNVSPDVFSLITCEPTNISRQAHSCSVSQDDQAERK